MMEEFFFIFCLPTQPFYSAFLLLKEGFSFITKLKLAGGKLKLGVKGTVFQIANLGS